MGHAAEVLHLTYQDYLALERQTDTRYEFLDGEAWMMSGGSLRHSALKANVLTAIATALERGPCRAFDADAKVRVSATGLATYPDLSVVCGPLERHPEDHNALTNPTVLVEVLSPTTERWDRGGKFIHYQQLASLRHYLLIDQDEARVEHFERAASGWHYSVHGPGERVVIAAANITLDIEQIYQNLPDA